MKPDYRQRYGIILKLFAVLIIASFFYTTAYADSGLLDEARNIIKKYYIENVSDETLNKPTIKEMVDSLNDPYSEYFSKQEFNDFVNSINMKFSGIGVHIDIVPEGVKVVSVIEGSGAEAAGIKAGDIITEADGHSLAGVSQEEAVSYIRGDEGTIAHLKVKRDGKILSFNVTRKQITTPTVEGRIINGHTGYIKISSFGEDTADDFGNKLFELNKKNPSNYIIDLRDNPGGYLDTALNIAGYFIGDSSVVKVRDRDGDEEDYKGYKHTLKIDKPVIFLTNGYSASASEVLSGAVKDHKKAFLVGTRTFGKGLVQTMFGLSDGSYIKLTVLKFFSPDGNAINKVGITPDFVVDKVDSELVAELLSGDSGNTHNKTGYAKVKIGDREFEVDLGLARQSKYYDAYRCILDKVKEQGNYIKLGSSIGWVDVPEDFKDREYLMYYPEYKELNKLSNIPVDKKFTITFTGDINRSTINSSSIELIDSASGSRVPLSFEFVDNRTVKAVPKENLKQGGVYYFIVNPTVKGQNGLNLNEGTITVSEVLK